MLRVERRSRQRKILCVQDALQNGQKPASGERSTIPSELCATPYNTVVRVAARCGCLERANGVYLIVVELNGCWSHDRLKGPKACRAVKASVIALGLGVGTLLILYEFYKSFGSRRRVVSISRGKKERRGAIKHALWTRA